MKFVVTGLNAQYLAAARLAFIRQQKEFEDYLSWCHEGSEVYDKRKVGLLIAAKTETALHIAGLVEFSGEVVES